MLYKLKKLMHEKNENINKDIDTITIFGGEEYSNSIEKKIHYRGSRVN